jgi:spore coat protein CotF
MANQPQEKEWAGTLLYLQKHEAEMICSAALESSDANVRAHCIGLLQKCLDNQHNLYNIMNQKGWYKVEAAPSEMLTKARQSLSMQAQMQ